MKQYTVSIETIACGTGDLEFTDPLKSKVFSLCITKKDGGVKNVIIFNNEFKLPKFEIEENDKIHILVKNEVEIIQYLINLLSKCGQSVSNLIETLNGYALYDFVFPYLLSKCLVLNIDIPTNMFNLLTSPTYKLNSHRGQKRVPGTIPILDVHYVMSFGRYRSLSKLDSIVTHVCNEQNLPGYSSFESYSDFLARMNNGGIVNSEEAYSNLILRPILKNHAIQKMAEKILKSGW